MSTEIGQIKVLKCDHGLDMTVDDRDVIDFVWSDPKEEQGPVYLAIIDHLPWNEEFEYDHLVLLQDKLNTYLNFVDAGELIVKFPNFADKKVIIEIVLTYEFSKKAQEFFNMYRKYACDIVKDMTFRLQEMRS